VTELWTTTQAAEHCGCKPRTFNDYVRRRGAPQPVGREPGRGGQDLYDAEAVRRWHAGRRGQGHRSDLVEK
jgi:phage terminase Nu1 subunit (DNA packaging protein)